MKEKRMQKAHGFAISTRERGLSRAEKQIKNICFSLGLPPRVGEGATYLYRQVYEKRLLKGRSSSAIIAAVIYHSSKKVGSPRSMEGIAGFHKVPVKEAFRAYKFISKALGLKVAPSGPSEYLPRFATKLGLGVKCQLKAARLLKGKTGKRSPRIMAAAALCIASGMTQKEVSSNLKVSEVSLREAIKELR